MKDYSPENCINLLVSLAVYNSYVATHLVLFPQITEPPLTEADKR
jgi:hypothetical protein